jgi:hypothetical protein
MFFRTAIFEWCVVKWGSQNGHKKGIMCLNEIELHAQNLLAFQSASLRGPI